MSFDRGDRLKFVDPPPADVTAAILRTLGTAVSRHERTVSHLEIKLNRYPWYPDGTDTVTTRMMILKLIETLETCGFTLYGTLDQSDDTSSEADVVMVHRHKDWKPGMPVWHR